MIPPAGTFLYVAVVREAAHHTRERWKARLAEEALAGDYYARERWKARFQELAGDSRGPTAPEDDLFTNRLVGYEPFIDISDAGLPATTGVGSPWIMRSRITLTASQRRGATMSSVAFHVGKAVMSRLQAGDELWLARNACGGLAVSLLRGADLIAAAGAVTSVPLGAVDARIPHDLIEMATAVFRRRDDDFELREEPVQITTGTRCCILTGGRRILGPYAIQAAHGFYPGLPGTSECVAIWHVGTGPEVDVIATSHMLDAPTALEMVEW